VDGKPEFVIEVEENGHETVEFRQGVAFIKSTLPYFRPDLKPTSASGSFASSKLKDR
jgi:hypothetical protein